MTDFGEGAGSEFGAWLRYDIGPVPLGMAYNLPRSTSVLDRHQVFADIGFRW